MVDYILKLELNYGNKMVFCVQRQERDVARILYEDCQRKGELFRDFSYLYPQYYASEEEWDDERNLITATIYPLVEIEKSSEMEDDLEYLAESMIEYKPAVDHKVCFCSDHTLKKYYSSSNKNRNRFINYIFSLCENKEKVDFCEDDFNHLTQL